MTQLAVVMVNWNTCALTRDCLKTVFTALEGLDAEVWMVDNASSDDSVAMLRSEFPQVKLIVNTENVGFARANNQILKTVEAEYYLLLNTDTIVPRNSIREMYEYMVSHPDVGAAGPKLKNAEGIVEAPLKKLPTLHGELRYCLASHFEPFNGLFRRLLAAAPVDWTTLTQPTESEVLSAACLIIRGDVVKKVGVLAEDYFLFSEEVDYFLRMRRLGLFGYYLPGTEVVHLVGVSRKKRGWMDSEANFFRSRQLFFRKHHSGRYPLFKLIYLPFICWSYLFATLKLVMGSASASEGRQFYGRLLKIWWMGA